MSTSDVRRPDLDFATAPVPDLHEVLAELREQEPVSRVLFAGEPKWLLNDYESVRAHIASDAVLSAPLAYEILSTPTMGRVLSTMTGRQHRRNRAVVSGVFLPARMREYAEGMFAEEAETLAEGLEGRDEVDLVAEFTRPFTFKNVARLLGLPAGDVTRLQAWADRIMHSFVDLDDAIAAGRELGAYLLPLIEDRRAEPRDDLISLLAQAEADGEGLSDEEILSFCRNLFPAAIDTSTNSLGSLLAYALADRASWRDLAHDRMLREKTTYELLRWEPPLVMIPRRCAKDVELAGHRLEAGDDVRLCLTGAHDDPKQFPEPRAFRIDREGNHLGFGHGEHFCLGTQMARRVLEKGVEVLATRFPDMAFSGGKSPEILGGVLRGPRSMSVAPHGL